MYQLSPTAQFMPIAVFLLAAALWSYNEIWNPFLNISQRYKVVYVLAASILGMVLLTILMETTLIIKGVFTLVEDLR